MQPWIERTESTPERGRGVQIEQYIAIIETINIIQMLMFNGREYKTINSPQINIQTSKKKTVGKVKNNQYPCNGLPHEVGKQKILNMKTINILPWQTMQGLDYPDWKVDASRNNFGIEETKLNFALDLQNQIRQQ
jgi:hypothetical protein